MGNPGEMKYKLNSGTEMPAIGLGTVALSESIDDMRKGTLSAFKVGKACSVRHNVLSGCHVIVQLPSTLSAINKSGVELFRCGDEFSCGLALREI